MEAEKKVQFNLAPELSPEAQSGHTYNDLKTGTLVLVGQLDDDDCDTIFSKHAAYVLKNGKIIIKGKRNYINNLWNIPLTTTSAPTPSTPTNNIALGIIQTSQTKQDLTVYFLACMFSPTPSIFFSRYHKITLRFMARTHKFPHLQTPNKIHSHQRGTPTNAVAKVQVYQNIRNSTKNDFDISP